MKIQLLFEHGDDLIPYGCSYIRLLLPYGYSNDHQYKFAQSTEYDKGKSDIYIIERLWKPGLSLLEAEKVVRSIRQNNKKLIYTLDDNLLDLQVFHNGSVFPSTEQKNIIRYFAREADALIVSTTPLKERFSRLNPNIYVVENAIDERLIKHNDYIAKEDSITIGYMGTPSHESDLLMVLGPLREILQKYKGKVRLELVGILSNHSVMGLFNNLPVTNLDVSGHVEYPKFMKWLSHNIKWDFAIAPLEDSVFSKSKSDIKFLDYGILGVPGIFSKVKPYETTIKHLETGYLVENTYFDWCNALEEMIANQLLRKNISLEAKNYVKHHRILKECYMRWLNVLDQI